MGRGVFAVGFAATDLLKFRFVLMDRWFSSEENFYLITGNRAAYPGIAFHAKSSVLDLA